MDYQKDQHCWKDYRTRQHGHSGANAGRHVPQDGARPSTPLGGGRVVGVHGANRRQQPARGGHIAHRLDCRHGEDRVYRDKRGGKQTRQAIGRPAAHEIRERECDTGHDERHEERTCRMKNGKQRHHEGQSDGEPRDRRVSFGRRDMADRRGCLQRIGEREDGRKRLRLAEMPRCNQSRRTDVAVAVQAAGYTDVKLRVRQHSRDDQRKQAAC